MATILDFPVYDGKHTLSFHVEDHLYYLDGINIPSVTTVLDVKAKPQLKQWAVNATLKCLGTILKPGTRLSQPIIDAALKHASKEIWRIRDEALTNGSMAHDWIEQYVQYCIDNDNVPPMILDSEEVSDDIPNVLYAPTKLEVRSSVEAFLSWTRSHDVLFLGTEERIVSLEHGWAGTRDIRAIIDGKMAVLDWKTSKAIYPEYFVQTAVYAKGGEEMGEDPYEELWVVRVPKDGNDFEAKNHMSLGTKPSIDELYEVFLALKKVWDFNGGAKRRTKKLKRG